MQTRHDEQPIQLTVKMFDDASLVRNDEYQRGGTALAEDSVQIDSLQWFEANIEREAARCVGSDDMEPYRRILGALKDVPWKLAPKVTPICPLGQPTWNFFPGQRGFCGSAFPVEGVMMVANNFDCLSGWKDYRKKISDDPHYRDTTRTTIQFEKILSWLKFPAERIFLTNYSLGVMDALKKDGKPTSRYEFPKEIREALGFKSKFEASVNAMQPRLIVTMGEYAADYIGTDYVGKDTTRLPETRTLYGCKAIAILHPAAPGITDEKFKTEAERINREYDAQ